MPGCEQVYLIQRRSVLLPMAETFDSPNLSASCPKRQSTIVAPQALTLMNSEFSRTEAAHLATRIERESDPVTAAFWLALGRPPTDTEAARARKLTAQGRAGLESLAVVLFNLNEFLYLE